MRFMLLFFAVVLLMTACGRHEQSTDDKIRKQLRGIWAYEARFERGATSLNTITVAPDGSYVSTTLLGSTNGPWNINAEGTLRVEGGFLIETITKDSQTNATVPRTSRSRIICIDDRELVLDYEKIPGLVYATNQVIFQKQPK